MDGLSRRLSLQDWLAILKITGTDDTGHGHGPRMEVSTKSGGFGIPTFIVGFYSDHPFWNTQFWNTLLVIIHFIGFSMKPAGIPNGNPWRIVFFWGWKWSLSHEDPLTWAQWRKTGHFVMFPHLFPSFFLGQFGKNGSKPCYCGKALKPKAPLGMVLNCFEYLPK